MTITIDSEHWKTEAKAAYDAKSQWRMEQALDSLRFVHERDDELHTIIVGLHEEMGGFYMWKSKSTRAAIPDEYVGSMNDSLERRAGEENDKGVLHYTAAAQLAERLGDTTRAVSNYTKAGNTKAAERVSNE